MDSDLGCIRQRTAPMVVKRLATYPPTTLSIEKSFKHSLLLPTIVGIPTASNKIRKSHYKIKQPIQEISKPSIKVEPPIQPAGPKSLPTIEPFLILTPGINASAPEHKDLLEVSAIKTEAGTVHQDRAKEVLHFKKPVVAPPKVVRPTSTCVCGRDNGDDMIGCNGPNCPREWFHIGCVGLARRKVKYMSSWYCLRCNSKRR